MSFFEQFVALFVRSKRGYIDCWLEIFVYDWDVIGICPGKSTVEATMSYIGCDWNSLVEPLN